MPLLHIKSFDGLVQLRMLKYITGRQKGVHLHPLNLPLAIQLLATCQLKLYTPDDILVTAVNCIKEWLCPALLYPSYSVLVTRSLRIHRYLIPLIMSVQSP